MPENKHRNLFVPFIVVSLAFLVWLAMTLSVVRWTKTENKVETSNKIGVVMFESKKIQGSFEFEKSPFVSARYNIFDNLVFKDVTALGGKNAWVNIKEDIKFKVDKNLPAGTAVLGGKVGLYDCSETTCHLERARVLVSSEEEMQKWDNSLYKVRQNYLEKNKPGPIFKEPQKVNPPFAK